VTVPLQLFNPPNVAITQVLGVITQLFWNFDIVANFFVGYYERGIVIMRPRSIAWNYFRSWFCVDLLIVVTDWVLLWISADDEASAGGLGRVSRGVRYLRGLRYLRLLRVLKLQQVFTKAQILMSEVTSVRFSIGRLGLAILVINHLIACFWWGVGRLECEARSWTHNFEEATLGYQYSTSLHWSISQFGVGNVEIEAENSCERVYCIVVLLFALIAFTSLVSSITNAMLHLRSLNDREKQFSVFRRYCQEQGVSKQLLQRMTQYIEFALDQQMGSIAAVDVGLLKLLSEPLYDELQKEIYGKYLVWHPFFRKLCHFHVVPTRTVCRSTLATIFLAPRDVIFREHQIAARMYFIEGGHLEYSRRGEEEEVVSPTWFSESVLWTPWLFVGRMEALTPCELVCVVAENFRDVMSMYPDTFRLVKRYAGSYVARLNATKESELTDLCTDFTTTAGLSRFGCFHEGDNFQRGGWLGRLRHMWLRRRFKDDPFASPRAHTLPMSARTSQRGSFGSHSMQSIFHGHDKVVHQSIRESVNSSLARTESSQSMPNDGD